MNQMTNTFTPRTKGSLRPSRVGGGRVVDISGVEMDPSVKFWDRIAERYSKRPVADEVSYQTKLAKTREYFRSDMEVLEIGCGTGSTAIAHAPYIGRIRATDISPNMIKIARAKAASVANVDFEVSSLDELRVPDGTLNMVLALSLLHLLEDEKAAIAKVFRMLKPGGLFVTSTPCLGDAWKYVALMALIGPLGKRFGLMPSVVRVFTLDALIAALTDAGFDIAYQWRPAVDKATFMVAKKPEDEPT